jgi:hypothetical protein
MESLEDEGYRGLLLESADLWTASVESILPKVNGCPAISRIDRRLSIGRPIIVAPFQLGRE